MTERDGGVALPTRRVRRSWRRVGAFALVAVLAWVAVAGRVLVLSRPVADPDLIVSLGSHEWERLPQTAVLAAEYPNAIVLLTIPAEVTEHNCHDCSHRVDRLVRAGVAASRIRELQLTMGGTRGEARLSREVAGAVPVKRLLIVTSPYHTRRALAVFRDAFAGSGIDIGIVPASAFSAARPAWWMLSPYDRWYVSYEWAATVWYALRYQVMPGFG